MSAEHAKQFVDLVGSDPDLQEAVKANQGNLVDLAKQKGFTVTQEELQEELRARWGIENPEGGYSSCGHFPDGQSCCHQG